MQMFLLAPVIMIPLAVALRNTRNLCKAMLCLGVLNVIALAVPIIIKLCFKDYVNDYDTHSRLISYVIGITMGTFMSETKGKPFLGEKLGKKNLSMINTIIWILDLTMLLGMLCWYRYVDVHGSYEYKSVLYMVCRFIWGIGISWMVYSSYHGYGGFVNWFLTQPIMQIGGKLSYCIYLLHPVVIFHYAMQWQTKMYFSDYTAFHNWCGYFLRSVLLAIFWTLAFESPLIIIERVIFGGGGGGRNRNVAKSTKPAPQQGNIEAPQKTDVDANKDT